MLKLLRQSTFTLLLSLLLLGAGLGTGAWLHYRAQQSESAAFLEQENERLQREKQVLGQMVERLSRTRRLAQIVVTRQTLDETTILLVELDETGKSLSRDCITIPGRIAYFDGLVIKFDLDSVAKGHPLRGQSIALLRRVYSERQSPHEGYLLDQAGDIPPGYRIVGAQLNANNKPAADSWSPGKFEERIWSQFWTIANDPELAAEFGVRVAQGEAVYKPMLPGLLYELTLDAAGGLNLETRPLPEAVAEVLTAAVPQNAFTENN